MTKKRSIKPFMLFFNDQGVNQNKPELSQLPDSATSIENLNVDVLGQWTPYNEGTANFSVQLESGATVDSLGWYVNAAGTDFLLSAVNGKIHNINLNDGTDTATIGTGFTVGNKVCFDTFKGTLYATSAGKTPQKWAGSGSMSNTSLFPKTISAVSYDKPKYCAKFYNRMAYANIDNDGVTRYPSHVLISDDLDPETLTVSSPTATSGTMLQVSPGDGQEITAIKTLRFPLNNETVLVIFKNRSIYAITGSEYSEFAVTQLNDEVGALSNETVLKVGSDLLFLDINNIYSLATATSSGTILPKIIGDSQVKRTLAKLNISAAKAAWAVHLPYRQEIWFAIPTGSSQVADTALVAYYTTNGDGVTQYIWSTRKLKSGSRYVGSCAQLLNKTLYTGTSDGYISKWHSTSLYQNTGVAWKYEYPYYNFGTQTQDKRVLECYAWFLVRGSETFSIKTAWRGNGNITKVQSKTVNLGDGTLSLYGTIAPPAAIYGINVYGSGAVFKKIKLNVIGTGQSLQFTVSGTTGSATASTFLGISGLVEYGGYDRSYR